MDINKQTFMKYEDEREVENAGDNPCPPDEGKNLKDVNDKDK